VKVIGIIPARYASSRLPGKPLVPILGKMMIQRVFEQTSSADTIDDVWVATDDQRICTAVEAFGGKAVMTSAECVSGTDRLAQAAETVDGDIIVNVQGDQPFIDPRMIDEAVGPLLDEPSLPMSTLIHPIHRREDLEDPGVVKAVIDIHGNGMYFSRSLIPAPHNDVVHQVYEHVGLYVYRREFLMTLAQLPQTLMERVEGLEQLRVIENGYQLRCVITACEDNELSGFSIDTTEDVLRGESMLRERGLQ
jgi:3-deoxy-manno-octulosonate cytidylyltransferase (CMP-KDO synthetase)